MRFKKNVFIALIIFVLNISAVFAANNAEIIKLKQEIDNINKKLNTLEHLEKQKFQTNLLENIQFHGRLHIEYLHSNNHGDAYKNLGGETGKKRFDNLRVTDSRFSGIKKLSDNTNFVISLKLVEDNIKLKEMYISYKITPNLIFDFGEVESSLTMEAENVGNVFATARLTRYYTTGNLFFAKGLGSRLRYLNDRLGIYTGIYGNDCTDSLNNTNRLSFNFKAFYNPYKFNNNIVHIGMNYVDTTNDSNNIPKIPTDQNNLIYDLKRFTTLNTEFALNFNWFNLQSEFIKGFVTPASTEYKKTFDLSNYYIQLAFLLTGETLKYGGGAFYGLDVKKPIDSGGFGAFELAFRISKTDLQDSKSNINFDYGKYEEFTTAFSWYPVNFIKTTIQYSRVKENFEENYAILANNNKKKNNYGIIALKNKIFF